MSFLRKLLFDWFLYPAEQFYRRMFRPETYGVRVVVWDRETSKILMVRHSYGDKTMWHFPGGAYRPTREPAENSAHRELTEETGLRADTLEHLFTYQTDAQGNTDYVEVYLFRFDLYNKQVPRVNDPEVAEVCWFDVDELLATPKVYRITRQSIRKLQSAH